MQPRQMRETSMPVRPSLVYFIVYPSQLRASCEVRDDIRREEFVSLDVVPVIAVDQQVHTGVLILADQIDGLGHCAHKTPQRSALSQPLTLRRHSGLVAAEQPAVIVGRFNRSVVTLRGVAMLTKYRTGRLDADRARPTVAPRRYCQGHRLHVEALACLY